MCLFGKSKNEKVKGYEVITLKEALKLTKEEVPAYVKAAYGGIDLKFGKEYIIPKPFDRRAFVWVRCAVAEAAVKDGVARVKDFDAKAYRAKLQSIIDAEVK